MPELAGGGDETPAKNGGIDGDCHVENAYSDLHRRTATTKLALARTSNLSHDTQHDKRIYRFCPISGPLSVKEECVEDVGADSKSHDRMQRSDPAVNSTSVDVGQNSDGTHTHIVAL